MAIKVVDSVDHNQDLLQLVTYMIVACVVTELSARKGKQNLKKTVAKHMVWYAEKATIT